MKISTETQEQIIIKFSIECDDGDLCTGALILTKDEYNKLSPEDINTRILEKYDDWVIARTPPDPYTKEERNQAELDQLTKMETEIAARKAEIETELILVNQAKLAQLGSI